MIGTETQLLAPQLPALNGCSKGAEDHHAVNATWSKEVALIT